MKKQLFLFFALTIYSNINSQNLQWVKRFGDIGGDLSRSVAVDAFGNVYTTGEFTGVVDFDPSASVYTLTTVSGSPIGNSNCYVSKLDAAGNFIWAKNITSSASGSSPKSILIDPLGNIYITGWFYYTVDFDPGASVYNLTSNGLEDIFISKLNSSGNFVWAKSMGSSNADYVYSMAVDANNNVITTGTFRGIGDFDPSATVYNIASAGADDIFISKLDIGGNFFFAKRIGDLTGDNSRGICVDASGNIYVTGSFSGTVDFDPGILSYNLSGAILTSTDFYLLKLDAFGSFIFAKNLGADIAQGASIERDAFGNIYVSGYFQNTVDFNPGALVYNLTGIPGQWDVFNLKLDASGNFIWANQINGTATQLGDIDLDAAGNFYITGVFVNTVDFDPSGSVFNLSATASSQDIFLCKLDLSGNFVWAKQFDGASSSTAYSMEVDAINNIYVTGLFDNTVDFDPNLGVFNLTSNGSYDAYVLKLGVPCAITSTLVAKSNVSCFGLSNGSSTISVSGGAIPYTYSWSPSGGSLAVGSSLSANTYTCFITDNNLCTAIQTVVITQPTAITTSISSQSNVKCNGANTGSVAIAANGGTGAYTYSWIPTGGISSNITNQFAGTYTCIIKDANLCSKTQTVNITEPTGITTAVSSQTNIICNSGNNGSALINASGGTGALTFSWVPTGGISALASSLTAGNYTCTVKDLNNCIKQQTVNITQPIAITTSIISQSNVTCNGTNTGSVAIAATGGIGAYTYSWIPTGGISSNITNQFAGTYTCIIKDANLCSKTQSVSITEPTVITTAISSQTNVICNLGNNGSALINASGGTGALTFSWVPTGGISALASSLTAGNYTCTVRDLNNCIKQQTLTITQPIAITTSISSQSNVTCNGTNTGSVAIAATGGSGAFTYSWIPTGGISSSITNQFAGTYTCIIKDANLCSKIQTVTITAPAILTAAVSSQTNINCNSGNNGSALINATGGTGTLTFSWVPTGGISALASSLTAGSYTCIVKDINNCIKQQTVVITQPTAITTSISSQSNLICNGVNTGSVAIAATGGTGAYTYSWIPTGGISSNITNQFAGTYTCIIKDANLCSKTQSVSITEPTVITTAISSQTNINCNSGNNGSALINATGGIGTLTFSWVPTGGISALASSLTAGSYTCIVKDINNCIKQQTVTIIQPNAITAISSQTNVSCFGGVNGKGSLFVSGGSGTYSYTWAPIGGNASVSNYISFGTYTCTITDINNCVKSTLVTITQPSEIQVSINNTSPSCIEVSDGISLLNVSGGVTPYNIIWSNGNTTLQNSNLNAGTYSVNIIDANSCTYTVSTLVPNATESCFFVSNGFSPNGDGINDTWEILGINKYPGAQIIVLNRWGQEMLNTNNYSSPWDGSFKGVLLPTSDYYYIINLNNGSKPLTGTLTIKR